MIQMTIQSTGIYSDLIKKERDHRNQDADCTFVRAPGSGGKNVVKWRHTDYPGWVWLYNIPGGPCVVEINSKANERMILKAFIGFLHRFFLDRIIAITITPIKGKK